MTRVTLKADRTIYVGHVSLWRRAWEWFHGRTVLESIAIDGEPLENVDLAGYTLTVRVLDGQHC